MSTAIKGSTKNDVVNAAKAIKGQHLPTDEADSISGGVGNDTISGLGGNDAIRGGTGNDRLSGVGGNDTIKGDAGNDTLNGGLGFDTLSGGSGVDKFVLSSVLDSVTASPDIITDFKHSQGDKIDLHGIDADSSTVGINEAFHYING